MAHFIAGQPSAQELAAFSELAGAGSGSSGPHIPYLDVNWPHFEVHNVENTPQGRAAMAGKWTLTVTGTGAAQYVSAQSVNGVGNCAKTVTGQKITPGVYSGTMYAVAGEGSAK